MKRFSKTTTAACVLLLAAIILRLIYLRQFSSSPLFNIPIGADVEEYDNWAREILAWGLNSQRLHIHAPFYPALLAALYNIFAFNMLWVRLFQTLLALGGFVALTWGIRRFVEPERRLPAWIFLVLAAFYPPLLFYSAELISESLLLPLLCLTLTLLYWGENQLTAEKFRKGALLLAAAGFCAGLMAITHPGSLIFVLAEAILLPLLARRRKVNKPLIIKSCLTPTLFALTALLVIAPVCIKNSIIARRFVLIQQNSGFNFYLGNNPDATGTCYVRPGKDWEGIHKRAEAAAAKQGVSKDKFLLNQAFDFIVSEPVKEFKLLVKKAFYVWNFRELTAGADSAPLRYFTGVGQSGKYLFILLGSLSICGAALVLHRRKTLVRYRHFLILAAAYWAMQVITLTSGRYRLPMYPAFFAFTAFSLDYLWRHRRNSPRQLYACLLLIVFGLLVVTLPCPPVNLQKEQAEADSLYGEACFKQGKYQQAAKYLEACLRVDPTNARAGNLLGIITEKDSSERAAEYYRRAIKTAPDEPEGYLNLAIQYSDKGRYQEAEKYFNKALRRGPDKPDVLYNYACYLQITGKPAAAVKYLQECLRQAPWYDKALNTLGVIYIRNKQAKAALKYLLRAHKLVPAKPGVMLNLAIALYENDRKDEAVAMLQKVLVNDPDSRFAKFLLNKWQNK